MPFDRLSGALDGFDRVDGAAAAIVGGVIAVASGAVDALMSLPSVAGEAVGGLAGVLGGIVGTAFATIPATLGGVLAANPLIVVAVGGVVVVAVVNPGGVRDELTWVAQLVGLAVLGYVAGVTIGPAVVGALGGVI